MAKKISDVSTKDIRPDELRGKETIRLSKNLSCLQDHIGWTNSQMAELLHISISQYGRIKNGGTHPSVDKLEILHYKFNVDLNWLLAGSGAPKILTDPNNISMFDDALNGLVLNIERTKNKDAKNKKLQKAFSLLSDMITGSR